MKKRFVFPLLGLVITFLFCVGCQRKTFELAEAEKPADAPEYTVEPELNPSL